MRPPEFVYEGVRRVDGGLYLGVCVTAGGRPLPLGPSLAVYAHSPSGFEWGYGGSGPTQLALALLLDATGNAGLAARCRHWFKWATVAHWGPAWRITAGEVLAWVERWKREDTAGPADAAGVVEGGAGHG